MSRVFYSFRQTQTTYDQFGQYVESRAQSLRDYRDQVVALWADNDPDFVINLFAIWRACAVPFVISRRLPWTTVSSLVEAAGASVVVTPDVSRCEGGPVPVIASTCETRGPRATGPLSEPPAIGSREQEVSLILHTSGTTNLPKLVRLTRDNLYASLRFEEARWRGHWTEQDATLGWLPLFHSFGLISELCHIYRTKSRYHFGEANPRALLDALEREPITLLSSVPWMLEQLIELPGGAAALARLRWIVVGGAPLGAELGERLCGAGVRVIQQHGMTELGAVFRGAPGGDWRDMYPVIPEAFWHLEDGSGQLIVHGDCPTLSALPLGADFATRDTFQRTSAGAYRFQIRLDDILVHPSGEKSNAPAVEQLFGARLPACVERVTVVGSGRMRLACIVQWRSEPSADDHRALHEAIALVNTELPGHSRLDDDLILSLSPAQAARLPLSAKGTVIRGRAEQEFAQELEQLYREAAWGDAVPPSVPDWRNLSLHDARTELRALVRAIAAQVRSVSGPEAIDSVQGFAEQGFDSLMALKLRARLSRALGLALSTTLVFDHPSVDSLVEHLVGDVLDLNDRAARPELGVAATAPALAPDEPIAIIGAACRFPGDADDLDGFWRVLSERRVVATEVPEDRWDAAAWYDPEPETAGRSYVKHGSFLRDVQAFDAAFFHISPREAQRLDPQQRLLLETGWQAIEHARQDPSALRHSPTGVFVAMSAVEYAEQLDVSDAGAAYVATGNAPSIAAGRLSYVLGLHGPSLAVDTACSSSLTALHIACQSLRQGECEQALVGAVNVLLSPRSFVSLSRLKALSPDGRCKPFSALADGFGRAEGCAVVVLKRLSDALRAGDRVLAVVRGSAVNNDGPSSGLTVPNGPAQQALLRTALARAGVKPSEVDLVECHGTGTLLGDPIEVQALGAVFGEARSADQPLWLGAVKANLGHLEAAAGMAGVLKVALALERAEIPAQPPLDELNPHIPWSRLPVEVAREARPWPRGARPRIAGVSSFGLGGTNVHVILEEAPVRADAQAAATVVAPAHSANEPAERGRPLPFLISARSVGALRAQAEQLRDHLASRGEQRLLDVAYALCATRSAFEHRAVLVADSRAALIEKLTALAEDKTSASTVLGRARASAKLALLFSGQGSQRVGMGSELYAKVPAFRAAIDAVFAAFEGELEQPLAQVMFAAGASSGAPLLDQTYAQPALFALQVALYRMLERWGVRPAWLLGHSVGELAAAHVAGVLSLAHACRLVAARGRLMQALEPGGAMAALEASEQELGAVLGSLRGADIAAVNGPMSCVVSGDEAAVGAVAAHFAGLGRKTSRLQVSHAFHSFRMEGMLAEFERVARGCEFGRAERPIVSTLTGRAAGPNELGSAQYWVEHVRHAVRFGDGVHALEQLGVSSYLELGPHGVLAALAQACVAEPAKASFWASLRKDRSEQESVLLALGGLHVSGHAVEFATSLASLGGLPVTLPTYAFQRTRHWHAHAHAHEESRQSFGDATGHPLLGEALSLAERGTVFVSRLSATKPSWVCGHELFGQVLLPGTALLEMALAAGERVGSDSVQELTLERPLVLPERGELEVQVALEEPDDDGRRALTVHSRTGAAAAWVRNATGTLGSEPPSEPASLTAWPPNDAVPIALEGLYDELEARGFRYGESFRGLRRAWQHGADLLVEVGLPEELVPEAGRYSVHPALLDAALHALFTPAGGRQTALPFVWTEVALRRAGASELRVKLTPMGEQGLALVLFQANGEHVGTVRGLRTRSASAEQLRSSAERAYRVRWLEQPRPASVENESGSWALLGESLPGFAASHYADMTALEAALARGERLPAACMVLLCTAGAHTDPVQGAHASTRRVLETLKAWVSDERLDAARLVIVTARAVATEDGEDVLDLAHAPVWGLVRSAQAEYPERFVLLDLDECSASKLDSALQRLSRGASEPQFALRSGELRVPRLAPADSKRPSGAPATRRLSEGTVLITGGLGTLGGLVANHLVRVHGAKHLVLCARSAGGDALKAELESAGAQVRIARCDLRDREAVRALLSDIPSERPLVAVLHAAAALKDGLLLSQGDEHIDRSFAGKLEGAWHLHELTRDKPLSAFVLFSSISGVWGNAGQVSYSAANTFLDALAFHRRAQGLPAVSLAWGFWGERSGLTRDLGDLIIARMARHGVLPMTSEHALSMLDEALGPSEALRVPMRVDTAALAAQREGLPAVLRELVRARGARSVARSSSLTERLSTLSAEQAERVLLDLVRSTAASIFGTSYDEVEPERPMEDLGLDSVMAVELRNRLGTATGLRLGATVVFDHPTPLVLAQRLARELSGQR